MKSKENQREEIENRVMQIPPTRRQVLKINSKTTCAFKGYYFGREFKFTVSLRISLKKVM